MILKPPYDTCAGCSEPFKDFDIVVEVGVVRKFTWPTNPGNEIITLDPMKGHYHALCIRSKQ